MSPPAIQLLLRRRPDLAPARLALVDTYITAQGLGALLDSKLGSRLDVLDLRDNLIGAEGARRIADSAQLAGLKQLNLGRCHIHDAGAKALASSKHLGQLERLELEYNFIGSEGARALAVSRGMPRLRDLGLAYNYLKDDGARALERSRWAELKTLDLRSNEIQEAGAFIVARSRAIPRAARIWFGSNLLSGAMARSVELTQRLDVEGQPPYSGRPSLGGSEGFGLPKRPTERATVTPPSGLPSTIEYRELWIWEFGLVGDFPTFMTPARRAGNGKSRDFAWLDRATLSIGGSWLIGETFAKVVSHASKDTKGERVRVERLGPNKVIVHRIGADQIQTSRIQTDHGAIFSIEFSHDKELDSYFKPIAKRVAHSLYFDRAHVK